MRAKEFDPDHVLDAAMQVFWKRGYAATSVQDLVDGTGLSRSSLYGTFESKQGLYQQALRRYRDVTSANVELLEGPGTARELILKVLTRIVEQELGDPQRRGCLVANATLELAGHDEAVAGLLAHDFQRLLKAFQTAIERGQQAGEVAITKDARALACFFLNTMQGMRVLGKGIPAQERRQCLANVVDVAISTL